MTMLIANATEPNWAEQVQAFAALAGLIGFALVIVTLWMQQTTLMLQQKQLSEQQKITELEQKRFLLEIKPELIAKLNWEQQRLTIRAQKYALLNVKFSVFKDHESAEIDKNKFELKIIPAGENDEIPFEFKYDTTVPNRTELFHVIVVFEDQIGTRYLAIIGVTTALTVTVIERPFK